MNITIPSINVESVLTVLTLLMLGASVALYVILLLVKRQLRRAEEKREKRLTSDPGPPLMYCPCCQSLLVKGEEQKRFETLSDHVSDPNEDSPRPLRDVYRCHNSLCEARRRMLFWSSDGEGPYGNEGGTIKWVDNNCYPFNSFARRAHFQISYHDEDRELCCKWFLVRREVKYQSNFHGDKVGKRVGYSLWLPKRGYLCHYTPGFKMFLLEIRHLRKADWNRHAVVQDVVKRAQWEHAEWWRKAAALWVKVFYRKYLLPQGATKANG